MSAPIKITCEFFNLGFADWQTECRVCNHRIWTSDWPGAMEAACGHLVFCHPRFVVAEPPC